MADDDAEDPNVNGFIRRPKFGGEPVQELYAKPEEWVDHVWSFP